MLSLVLVLLVFNSLVFATENKSKHVVNISGHAIAPAFKNNVASHHNISYIDKAENMLRTPNINKFYKEHKKKQIKKSPKRTIQKIIKKNRSKVQKIYVHRITKSTSPPQKIDYDKMYQEDKQWREEVTTTQANLRKRSKKYSPRNAGYHIPFQKHHAMKTKRTKRGLSRELYILKDLDEIEFLSKEDGDDVVKAHIDNIWQV